MAEGETFEPVDLPTSTLGRPKYCKRCLYPLRGLTREGSCPECGRLYDLSRSQTYTTDPNPPSVWKRLGRCRAEPLGLLAVVVSWSVVMKMSVEEWFGLITAYPLWSLLACYLVIDLTYRIVNRTPKQQGVAGGACFGFTLGFVNLVFVGDADAFLLPIISALAGGIAGWLVILADRKQLRDA